MDSRDSADYAWAEITEQILGGAYRVSDSLGSGFLEKVYENALAHELRKTGLKVMQQHGVSVHYDGIVVGEYFADLLVADQVIVELKAVSALDKVHEAQCLNDLMAAGLRVCLLPNFGTPKVEVRRIVL